MNVRTRWMIRAALLLAVGFWIAFIFYNSSQTSTESGEKSTALLEWINSVLDWMHLPKWISETLIRKSGHFAEFTLLGILVGSELLMFTKNIWGRLLCPLVVGILTAMTDETIQLFIQGRSSEVRDVWIDSAGTALGIVIVQIAFIIICHIAGKRKLKHGC